MFAGDDRVMWLYSAADVARDDRVMWLYSAADVARDDRVMWLYSAADNGNLLVIFVNNC